LQALHDSGRLHAELLEYGRYDAAFLGDESGEHVLWLKLRIVPSSASCCADGSASCALSVSLP
jgi:hypothetical protein